MNQHTGQGSMYPRREEGYPMPQNPSMQLPHPSETLNSQSSSGPMNPLMPLSSSQGYGQQMPNASGPLPQLVTQVPLPPAGSMHGGGDILAGQRGQKDGIEYRLTVGQQPIRARMCGFGDKDRRPITPPPCFLLELYSVRDGRKIDVTDHMADFLVATVDLWDKYANSEVNLVRSSSGAPSVSISTSSLASYPPPAEHVFLQQQRGPPGSYPPNMPVPTHDAYGRPSIPPSQYSQQPSYYGAPTNQTPVSSAYSGYAVPPGYGGPHGPQMAVQPVQQAAGLFTRNLIGSLTVNAFKLNDPEGKVGLWFIFQDLSIRTEGVFRLKVSFVDVGNGNNGLNMGKAPILATCYTDSFQVYSAKKFPGVIESTPLSKCFAQQGIKIPIRKDGPKIPNQDEFDADD